MSQLLVTVKNMVWEDWAIIAIKLFMVTMACLSLIN